MLHPLCVCLSHLLREPLFLLRLLLAQLLVDFFLHERGGGGGGGGGVKERIGW